MFKPGNIPWNKGHFKPLNERTVKYIKKGYNSWNKGKIGTYKLPELSTDAKLKISRSHIGKSSGMKGKEPWNKSLTKTTDERLHNIGKHISRSKKLFYKTEDGKFLAKKQSVYMKNGGAAHAISFNTTPSKPQVQLFMLIKSKYTDAIINYPCLNYAIDIAIPSIKVAIEYDEPFWHVNKEDDYTRQKAIENFGWRFIRYEKIIPEDIIFNDIKNLKEEIT